LPPANAVSVTQFAELARQEFSDHIPIKSIQDGKEIAAWTEERYGPQWVEFLQSPAGSNPALLSSADIHYFWTDGPWGYYYDEGGRHMFGFRDHRMAAEFRMRWA
jgi:hypothetical protein